MNIVEIIEKKKLNKKLSRDEIDFFVSKSVSGEIADYQISALLMAIRLNGMDEEETFFLTDAMKNSGDQILLEGVHGIKIDKHSTGGVGDSTTFIVAPIVAALDFKVAKISGRGLGFTGGTLDKLESFDSLEVGLSPKRFQEQVNKIGLAVSGQSADICPADKIFYALRDVTSTVDSIPLIASSIMSKKLAVATDILVLDVKVGDGSLLNDYKKTKELAALMVKMGKMAGKKVAAILSSMDEPLDDYIGNSLEIEGALSVLKGEKNNLYTVAKELAVEILMLSEKYDKKQAEKAVEEVISNGTALKKFEDMLKMQGAKNLDVKKAKYYAVPVLSKNEGYISKINTRELGLLVMRMGGGRLKKDDKIDATVGIKILKRTGDSVRIGEAVLLAYANTKEQLETAKQALNLFEFSKDKKDKIKLIYETIR